MRGPFQASERMEAVRASGQFSRETGPMRCFVLTRLIQSSLPVCQPPTTYGPAKGSKPAASSRLRGLIGLIPARPAQQVPPPPPSRRDNTHAGGPGLVPADCSRSIGSRSGPEAPAVTHTSASRPPQAFLCGELWRRQVSSGPGQAMCVRAMAGPFCSATGASGSDPGSATTITIRQQL